jgi:hypothetical protein
MTEDQLQQKCVLWFHKEYKSERGMLFRTENKTNRNKKGLGLIKGVSDLNYCSKWGHLIPIEIKVNGSSHKTEHLKNQYDWCKSVQERSGLAFFVFSFEHFMQVMNSLMDHRFNAGFLALESADTLNYIKNLVGMSSTESVKLDYIMSNYDPEFNSIQV